MEFDHATMGRPAPVLYMDRGGRAVRLAIAYGFVIAPCAGLLTTVALIASTDRPLGWLIAAIVFLVGVPFLVRTVPRWLDRAEEGDIDRLNASLLFVTLLSVGGAGITFAVVSNLPTSPMGSLTEDRCVAAITSFRRALKDELQPLARAEPLQLLVSELGCPATSVDSGFGATQQSE